MSSTLGRSNIETDMCSLSKGLSYFMFWWQWPNPR